MKKVLVQKFKDLFWPRAYLGIDAYEVLDALKDDVIRKTWLYEVLEEIKRMSLDIDKKLLEGTLRDLTVLSARRKALQFILDKALEAKREVERARNHNPQDRSHFDLESVTVQPSPH